MADLKMGINELIKQANEENPKLTQIGQIKNKTYPVEKYLNPRTRKVFDHLKSEWKEVPTKWNKMIKLPDDNEELMGLSRWDLEDKYDINGINIDLGDNWRISDDWGGDSFQVVRGDRPWLRWKKGGVQNETEVMPFNSLREAYDFYMKNRG